MKIKTYGSDTPLLMRKIILLFLIIIVFSISVSAVQFARPDGNVSDGGWIPTPLWKQIDEAVQDDTDYINSTASGSKRASNVSLSGISDPTSSSGHIIRTAARAKDVAGASIQVVDYRVRLLQGSTAIASFTHLALTTSFQTFTDTLSAAEADSITDYSNLTLEFQGTFDAAVPRRKLLVSWAEFEVPNTPNPLQIFLSRGSAIFRLRGNGLLMFRG